ncbi:MAG: hypothetical protein E7504_00555 [Ruminococcus sp.]|nr:hypothetical protein [Ruminococcus sp.]
MKGGFFMHAILFCDGQVSCIPVNAMPEALLPYCNIPLLAHILRYCEQSGITDITLVGADRSTRRFADSLPVQPQLHYAEPADSLRTEAPTLVLRRLCLPQWDMGELHSFAAAAPVRLLHADGSPTDAELHSVGSTLSTPEKAVTVILSEFPRPETPSDYLRMQQNLLDAPRMSHFRIGQGLRTGKQTEISESCVIGSDCIIGDHAVLEDCVLGDGVQIGAGTVLRRCVICRHALIDRQMTLEDAAVGQGEIVSTHSKTPQKRLFCVDEQDGIHEGLPRWNTVETALQTGAAMTALGMRIAVGYDRKTSEPFALAAASGAAAQGAQVWNCGVCALSQLIHCGKTADCDSMIWVHGDSVQYLTVRGADGFALTSAQNRRLLQALEGGLSTRIAECGKIHSAQAFHSLWESECRKILPEPRFTIEVCCGNPLLRETAQRLFSGGTGDRIVLNLSDDGTQASAFSTESGMISHDSLLLLSLLSFREKGEALALPAQFHPAAEAFAAHFGGRILRLHTPAVTPTAAKAFARQGVCTDGILLFCHILRILDTRHIPLAAAASLLPTMHTARREISTRLSRQTVEKLRRSNPDRAVRLELPTNSGILRLMAYADSMETASELCSLWEKKLRAAEDGLYDLSQSAE